MTGAVVDGISFRQSGGVLTATLEATGGNLMSMGMCEALTEALVQPPPDAHVLVIRATGHNFCLGRERTAVTVDSVSGEVTRLVALNTAFAASRLVTVARVQGDAAGYGVGLAALADVAVGVESAQFNFPEVGLGLAPAIVLAWLQPLVGRREAFWLTATGEAFSALRATELGILNEVVSGLNELDAAVQRRVDAILAASPRVHGEIKAVLRVTARMTEDEAYEVAGNRLALASLRRALGER